MTTKSILLLPGDGIGPEVVAQARRVLEFFTGHGPVQFVFDEALIGGAAYEATGTPFPAETLEKAKAADAILLGAVGGPQWEALDYSKRPERGLLGIRKELDLFANLRPAMCFDALADASTLKRDVVAGLDILIVRELTGDIYFGHPRGVTVENGHRVGRNTMIYADWEVTRIAKVALDLARARGKKLCSVDKANVLECTEMWREEVQKLRDAEYTDIALSHMYVDNAAMQLVRNPKQFDVVVTGNIFGDILSDCAAMLTGSLGMLPSASLGAEINGKRAALYEPVHGSAPDIAGKGVANPIATILSVAMMLRYSFALHTEADLLEAAVAHVLADGLRTGDIMQDGAKKVGTTEMGDAILTALATLQKQRKVA
ncbi:MAG: 3-isopropylmalate dehydrogenase [Rhodospirillales bacterium 12-54-5]|nr:MAG: 3-isopropylmalate dehydrogenase [Rhodospirillales bacterium 12-54-5]